MRVLIVEPDCIPYEADVKNDLYAEQKIVGGLIEPVYLDDGALIICNEEGIIDGMPFNRLITKADDWKSHTLNENEDVGIFGTFFVCGGGEENFESLSPELMEKHKAKFAQAHELLQFGSMIIVGKTPAKAVPPNKRLGQKPTKNTPER